MDKQWFWKNTTSQQQNNFILQKEMYSKFWFFGWTWHLSLKYGILEMSNWGSIWAMVILYKYMVHLGPFKLKDWNKKSFELQLLDKEIAQLYEEVAGFINHF